MESTNTLIDKKMKYKRNKDIRFYEKEYPEEGDIIMCQVTKLTDIGVYLSMIEYGHKKAFMPYTEVTKRGRIRKSIKTLVNMGSIMPTLVINIQDNLDDTNDTSESNEHRSVDVSKKEVSYDDGVAFTAKFNQAKKIRTIFQRFARVNKLDIYDLYARTIWKIEKELDNTCYNLLKGVINDETGDYPLESSGKMTKSHFSNRILKDSLFDVFDLDDVIKAKVIKMLEKKLTDTPKKIFAKIKVTCYTEEGIDAIKSALRAGLNHSNSNMKISIQLNSSPFYNIVIISKKVSKAVELMNKCMEDIERVIKEKKGHFGIDIAPQVLDNY